ncbi:MAG: bifunctional folylpolyglutamate synthase/dihydrofolate synthase [Clostridia bacterium]|nr:bifunctional folylpolyglutamate synthase/dihydrofolate synthase [Clostridia bacterium]
MTYEEALQYIHSVCWKGSRPGLERISELCRLLGDPQKDLRFVHVAGTNGKGSVSAMMTSILMAEGKTVGTFTSPFIFDFRERMCVNGEMISETELAEVTEYVRPYADMMEDSPTEFELITAIGLVFFKKRNCDVVVLEAGMGGRLDSTNIIEKSEVSIITGIALDHTEYLGDTVEKIAAEKAGIIKNGCPVIAGKADRGALDVIKAKASEKSCAFHTPDYSALKVHKMDLGGSVFDYGEYKNIHLKLVGSYQPRNAAVAITAAEAMGASKASVIKGLSTVQWRGRFEILRSSPTVIYDGGHNIQCVEAITETLNDLSASKVVLLSAVMADKEYKRMAEILSPFVLSAYCVVPENTPRALSAEDYAKVYNSLGVEAEAKSSVMSGLSAALERAKNENIPLLVCGSLYLYREFVDCLESLK